MSKKKASTGAPTWIVTFADLMSLLLTFFVLLLSFSTMEVQKFEKVSGGVRDAFGLPSFDRLAKLIQLYGFDEGTDGKHVVYIPVPLQEATDLILPDSGEAVKVPQTPVQGKLDEDAKTNHKTFLGIKRVLTNEVSGDVMMSGNATVIRFPSKHTFESGHSDLIESFLPVLEKILSQLEQSDGEIIISGHTDNVPITNEKFRSNWDLSSSRATSVAHYILEHSNIDSSRITVQGFADSRPLKPNTSDENRAMNRRIEIMIQSKNIIDISGD